MPNELINNPFNIYDGGFCFPYIYDGSFCFPYSDYRYILKRDVNLNANSLQELLKVTNSAPTPTKIIRSGPVTVIFWEDGTKTLVRRAKGAPDDPYLAFCAGLAKKIYGNNSKVKKLIEEKTVETKEKEKKVND